MPKKEEHKAGVGIVKVDGQETPLICLDLHTAQVFLHPDDAVKLGRKLVDLGYEAMPTEPCKWCGSRKNVLRGECSKCRRDTKNLQRTFTQPKWHGVKTLHQEFASALGYSPGESGAPEYDPSDPEED